jgi:hypothetical protein
MAENESLDLGNPGGQRWNQFHDAVRKGNPPENAAEIVQRKLPAALRKAFKEFVEHGVSFDQLMAARQAQARGISWTNLVANTNSATEGAIHAIA